MIYTIIALIIMIFGLINDFKKDPGLNKKAKLYHTIMLTILIFSLAGLIDNLVSYVKNFSYSNDTFSYDMGIIPGKLNIIYNYANLIFSVIVQILYFLLIFRKNFARIGLFLILPFWVLLYVVSYCRGLDQKSEIFNMSNIIQMLPGIAIFGGIVAAYIVIYTRQFMKAFFEFKNDSISGNNLDTNK